MANIFITKLNNIIFTFANSNGCLEIRAENTIKSMKWVIYYNIEEINKMYRYKFNDVDEFINYIKKLFSNKRVKKFFKLKKDKLQLFIKYRSQKSKISKILLKHYLFRFRDHNKM